MHSYKHKDKSVTTSLQNEWFLRNLSDYLLKEETEVAGEVVTSGRQRRGVRMAAAKWGERGEGWN